METDLDKPYLFTEDLVKLIPLCLSEDSEVRDLGLLLLDTYDDCLWPVTVSLLKTTIVPRHLPSKTEEEFLGDTFIKAFSYNRPLHYNHALCVRVWFHWREILLDKADRWKK